MAHTPQMSGYIVFMQWFQDKHPELYNNCWKTIAVPINDGQVTMEKDGIAVEVVEQIVDTIAEYYKMEKN